MTDRLLNLLMRVPGSLARHARMAWLRALGVRMGRHCWIQRIEITRNPWDIEFASHVCIDHGVVLLTSGERAPHRRISIGSNCYINRSTMIDAADRVEIGDHTLIGPFCYITDHDHGFVQGISILRQPLNCDRVRVGSNVWLGAAVKVLKGVTIGDGAIVGAGSVVTRSIPPNAIAVGSPARVIGHRPPAPSAPSGGLSVEFHPATLLERAECPN